MERFVLTDAQALAPAKAGCGLCPCHQRGLSLLFLRRCFAASAL